MEAIHDQSQIAVSGAIDLSNRAATLLVCGDYDEAASLLLDAVRQFREGKQFLDNIQDTSRRRSRGENIYTKRRSEGEEYVYSTPIFISESDSLIVTPSLVRLSIVFNFAIARHLKALNVEGPKRGSRLRTTLKLYNWVFSIERMVKEEQSPFGVMPCLGLINNCGQIHRYLNKQEKAEKMFRLLLSSLMLLKERGEEEEVHTRDLDGFFSTTSHLILLHPTVAKAA